MKKLNKRSFELFICIIFLTGLSVSAFSQNMFRKINDFDGDGKADFAITRNVDGAKVWYIWQSTNGFRVAQWGFNTDDNAPGDYDGDGKTDLGIYRREPVNANTMRFSFWINASQAGVLTSANTTNLFLQSVAVQQDYNGDGKTDFAYTHSSGTIQTGCPVGIQCVFSVTGTPVRIGDLDGDGKAEVSEYTSSGNNNVLKIVNPVNYAAQTIQFGLVGDEFVPADFDGSSM